MIYLKKLLSLFLLGLTSISIQADTNNPIRVATVIDYVNPTPPYRWIEECVRGNKSIGVGIHLLTKVFQDIGYPLQQLVGNTSIDSTAEQLSSKYQQLADGETDFLITVRKPAGYDQLISIKTPLLTHRTSVVTKADNPIFTGQIASLQSHQGGLFSVAGISTPAHKHFTKLQFPTQTYPNNFELLTALMAGDVDYVVVDYYTAKIWSHINDTRSQLLINDADLPDHSIYLFAAKQGKHADLIDEINTRLHQYHNNNYVKYLNELYLKKWLDQPCE